jgi:hypothetical protein
VPPRHNVFRRPYPVFVFIRIPILQLLVSQQKILPREVANVTRKSKNFVTFAPLGGYFLVVLVAALRPKTMVANLRLLRLTNLYGIC